MKLLKSHRDQKCRPYAYKALQFGCTLLEIDIQQAQGEIVLGHNWRPKLKFLFDCTLDQYMHRVAVSKKTATIFIQLDVKQICFSKTEMIKFARLVVRQMKPFKNVMVPLIGANAGWNRPETAMVIYEEMIKAGFDVSLYSKWQLSHEITTQDLWV